MLPDNTGQARPTRSGPATILSFQKTNLGRGSCLIAHPDTGLVQKSLGLDEPAPARPARDAYDGIMRYCSLAIFALASYTAGCGKVGGAPHEPIDASEPDAPAPLPDAATPVDAASVGCKYVPSTASSQQVLAYTFTGGSFQSYGCMPVDPTYWLSGSGMSVTVTFAEPQARPSVRVWGMNTDDTASMAVNGTAYSLDASSASLAPKVTCGVSPGPDGVAFVSGMLMGANTPSQGNYSYQDITVEMTGVTSIQLTGLTGAGWGFAGTSVGCAK